MLLDQPLLILPFFALLLVLSIFSISLITEKILLFRKWRCHSKNLHNRLSVQLREGKVSSLKKLLKNPRSPEAQLIQKSLHFIKHEMGNYGSSEPSFRFSRPQKLDETKHNEIENDGYYLELWVQNCIEKFGLQLEKHINLFHLIANVATLLGLLGTVTGMIYAFQSGALEQSTQLAQGISQALITTAGGLVVAIPAIISQQLFQNAIGIRISKLEQLGRDIVFFQYKYANHYRLEQAKEQASLGKNAPVDLTRFSANLKKAPPKRDLKNWENPGSSGEPQKPRIISAQKSSSQQNTPHKRDIGRAKT